MAPYASRGNVRDFTEATREYRRLENVLAVDQWHAVGGANKVQFRNSFLNYTGDTLHTTAAFRRNPWGQVSLRGLITAGIAPAPGVDLFFLPEDYRPRKHMFFMVLASDGTTIGPVRVNIRFDDGGVEFENDLTLTWVTTSNSSFLDIGSISFYVDTA